MSNFHEDRAGALQTHLTEVWAAARALNERAEIVGIGVLCHEMLAHDADAYTIWLEPSDNDENARFQGWTRTSAKSIVIDCEHGSWDEDFDSNYMWPIASSIAMSALEEWSFVTSVSRTTSLELNITEALTALQEQLGTSFDTPTDLTPAGIEAWLADRKKE